MAMVLLRNCGLLALLKFGDRPGTEKQLITLQSEWGETGERNPSIFVMPGPRVCRSFGYVTLGFAYGLYMHNLGFHFGTLS